MRDLQEIVSEFDFAGRYQGAEECTTGHINDTFFVQFEGEDTSKRYVLQRINHHVFRQPAGVMENIAAVTDHLRRKIRDRKGDPSREALRIIPTKEGQLLYRSQHGEYWRAYDFIEGARTYQQVEKPVHFYHAGRTFGQFQCLLSDFPAESLHETIERFHDTPKRLADLRRVVDADSVGRVAGVQREIDFVLQRSDDTAVIVDLMSEGSIPLRVTHNDTKFNNILIDDETGEGICVLDLDTVMPGSALYDFGDAIRFGASTAKEDEPNLDLVALDLELFTHFTRGYLEMAREFLNPMEIKHLAFSAKLLTLETGIRFLADYLDGDQYFRIERPGHNLERARTQFKLVADMEAQMSVMEDIVQSILRGDLKEGA
ncbi:MAG: aminoglycoside phosphotransferase family protein [Firmicutes bacterium]|nr:aminoglycoside phosphotransferase family protein [Bacillota bacterium]